MALMALAPCGEAQTMVARRSCLLDRLAGSCGRRIRVAGGGAQRR